jgi:hypothetical protein
VVFRVISSLTRARSAGAQMWQVEPISRMLALSVRMSQTLYAEVGVCVSPGEIDTVHDMRARVEKA